MTPTYRRSAPPGARLFDDAHAAPPAGVHTANIDGASRGNPGPASYAVILRGPEGTKIADLSKCIGRQTNNIAEYYALVAALDYAAAHSIGALRVRSDSELLVRQMQGRYKVKNADLKPLHERAQKLSRGLGYFVIEHVRREENREADALANLALDGGGSHSSLEIPQAARRSQERAPRPLCVQAHYRRGAFIPTSPLEIPEETAVELEVRILKKS